MFEKIPLPDWLVGKCVGVFSKNISKSPLGVKILMFKRLEDFQVRSTCKRLAYMWS